MKLQTKNLIKQKRFLHNKSNNLDPWFVTGLIDAEGCFMIGLTASSAYKQGYNITLKFSMSMHEKDMDLLIKLQNFFGVGTITKHGPTTIQYKVTSIKDMLVIITHCTKFPLITYKAIDFLLFKNAYELIIAKLHLTEAGFKNILSIRASLNLGLTDKLKLAFPNVVPATIPTLENCNIKNPNWLSGFTSGDGCFNIIVAKSPHTKTGYRVVLRFLITQHNRDIPLLKSFITYLECGRVESISPSASNFVVTKFSDITDKIIPFFDKYAIHGIKSLDYVSFKQIAMLMKENEHLTEEGLEKIKLIKSNMNKSRKL